MTYNISPEATALRLNIGIQRQAAVEVATHLMNDTYEPLTRSEKIGNAVIATVGLGGLGFITFLFAQLSPALLNILN